MSVIVGERNACTLLVELWDYMDISCLIFCKIVFHSSCTILHSTSNVQAFLSPTITDIIV